MESGLTFVVGSLCGFLRQVASTVAKHELLGLKSIDSVFLDLVLSRNFGLCDASIARLQKEFTSLSLKYYFYLLGPPKIQRDHSNCREDCVANQVDNEIYVPQHDVSEDDETCLCERLASHLVDQPPEIGTQLPAQLPFSPDLEEVTNILRRGEIPVISMTSDSDSLFNIRVVEYKPGLSYIALSHIWADGLGNPKENAIRFCQLFRIRAMVDGILRTFEVSRDNPDEVFLWIDTLLVPIPSHD